MQYYGNNKMQLVLSYDNSNS